MMEAQLASFAGQGSVKPFLATRCDGTREAFAWVATPYGAGLVRIPPEMWASHATAGAESDATAAGEDREPRKSGG